MRLKIKKRSWRYDINWSRPRHRHNYTKYKMCLSIMMVVCIKQHLSNIWTSVHDKVKQHWDWVEKKNVTYKKSMYFLTFLFCILKVLAHTFADSNTLLSFSRKLKELLQNVIW